MLLASALAACAYAYAGTGSAHSVLSWRSHASRAASASIVATAELERLAFDRASAVPDGVLARNVHGAPWVEQRARPRRNRKSASVRKMVRETVR